MARVARGGDFDRGSKPKPPPAATPDELIKTGKNGRIRLIEKRRPRRPGARQKSR
jgi:hypothetical protein